MGRDIMDHHFLGPRIADKLVLSLIVMSLYYAVSPPARSTLLNACAGLSLRPLVPAYISAQKSSLRLRAARLLTLG